MPSKRTTSSVPSLRDIAAELDISVSLVSKVLSGRMGSTGVSGETRHQILEKAREHNFVPNRAASALRARRTGAIGVFLHPVGELGAEITSDFLRGFSKALSVSNFHMWLTLYGHSGGEFQSHMDLQDPRRQADAIVLAGFPHAELNTRLEELEAAGMPVITIFESGANPKLTNVAVDSFLQGKLPTAHLLAAGCRRIVHLTHMTPRLEGFLAAHREVGLEALPGCVIPVADFKLESGRQAVRRLLSSGVRFDGIVAQSDHAALGALYELLAAGLRVPEDVRVCGVDDTILATSSPVPLTSVTTEARAVGHCAAEMVLKRLAGEAAASTSVPPRLVVRASTT